MGNDKDKDKYDPKHKKDERDNWPQDPGGSVADCVRKGHSWNGKTCRLCGTTR